MKKRRTVGEIVAWCSIAAFVLLGIVLGIRNFYLGEMGRGLLGLASPAFLLIPPLMSLLKIRHPYRLYTLLFLFCILAYQIGCVYQAFDAWPFFDKISHFLSGIAFTILGFCFYIYIEGAGEDALQNKWLTAATYALFFSLFVAVVWEVGEFTGYLLTGHDSQHHETTGVFDTMGDLIACLLGSLISALSFVLYRFRRCKLLTPYVLEEFWENAPNK